MYFEIMKLRLKHVISIPLILLLLTTSVLGQSPDTDQGNTPSYTIIGFVQQQFAEDLTPGNPAGFSIHRARVGVNGNLSDRIRFRVFGGFIEPPQSNPQLVHAYADYTLDPRFNIRAGQFLAPFGIEGSEGIIFNPAIERSLTIRRLNTFRMFSDIGVQIFGSWSQFNYAVGLVNGTGANLSEQIDPKDIVGRVGFNFTEQLEIGLSGHAGYYKPGENPEDEEPRYRAGLDLSYNGKPLFIRGEYVTRKNSVTGSQDILMNGGYLLAGYKLTDRVEAIVRYEYLNPNRDIENNRLEVYTMGANYYMLGRSRISINYEIRDDKFHPDLGNLLTVQMQIVL